VTRTPRHHRRESAARPAPARHILRPPDPRATSVQQDSAVPPVEGHVVLLGRSGCHLCAAVTELIAAVQAEHPELIPDGAVEVDVDSDPALRSRWGDHVPVTFVDGVLIGYWYLDRDTLMAALTEGPTQVRVIP